MASWLNHFGWFLIYDSSQDKMRGGVIFFFTHLVFLLGMAFLVETILILSGLYGWYVPLADPLQRVIGRMVF